MGKQHAILPAIFTASFASLSFEILLTRIFAISLWYHFAFMVISIAMLGIGASGTLLAVYPRLKDRRLIPVYCAAFSLAIPAGYLAMNNVPFDPMRLSWDKSQLFYIGLYCLSLSPPFFFSGLIVSTAFSILDRPASHIYGADLTGAGSGSLLTLWLLSKGGPERIVFVIGAAASVSLFFSGGRKSKLMALTLICINALIFFLQPSFIELNISPYKPLESALKFPGAEKLNTLWSPFSRVDIFRSPAARFAPGLSFKYSGSIPDQIGISVDAGEIYAVSKGGDKNSLDFIPYLPSSLPYDMSHKGKVLILEPKGGLPALTAGYYGSQEIFKVDSDPLVIEAVRDYLGDFSSGIYKNGTWTGIGRSWLAAADQDFDLIDIWMLGSVPAGSSGFSEDYRFTVEAFESYLSHLAPAGMLSINLYMLPPPRSELRLISTLAAASNAIGIDDFGSHIAAIRTWGTVSVVVKKTPLSPNDIGRLKNFAHKRRFDLIYYPGIREEETNIYVKMPSNEYHEAFSSLISPDTRKHFIYGYLFDIRPVHDENPFFHYYLKLENIKDIYKVMGGKWQYFIEEGYLLPVIFLQVTILGLVLVVVPALRPNKPSVKSSAGLFMTLSYFALLGVGFMFTEMALIQKMILPLENPPFAMSVVLSSLLISSGAGSLLSSRSSLLRRPQVLAVIALLILIYVLMLPVVIPLLYAYPLKTKLFAVFIILLPAGLLLGIPFPLGISLLSGHHPSLIPWAWAVNGCFSVIAPILAVMLALSVGFKVVLAAGAGMYLLAFLSLRRLKAH